MVIIKIYNNFTKLFIKFEIMLKFKKNLFVVLGLIFILPIGCCKKEKSKTEVVIDYPLLFPDNMELDNNTNDIDSLIQRITPNFPTQFDGELAKNNTNKSLIKSAKLTSMTLQTLDYAYADSTKYANFKDLSAMYLDVYKSNFGQVNAAFKENIPDVRTKILTLNMKDVELKQYLQSESFQFIVKYRKRRARPNEMPYIIKLNFHIVADPL